MTGNETAATRAVESRSKRTRLAAYLREEVRRSGGEAYVKSKFIADDVDLSPKEIGAFMRQLEDAPTNLAIERWAYSGATTWRVSIR